MEANKKQSKKATKRSEKSKKIGGINPKQSKEQKDIFIDIEPATSTTILVTDKPALNQQVTAQLTEEPINNEEILTPIVTPSESEDITLSLPPTVTRLNTANGAEVFIVGTSHFSPKSVEDVRKVISSIKPSAVILELCKERAFMLSLDEQSLLEQNRKLSFDKIRSTIAEKGLAQGLIFIMFVKMSVNLTEKLGMAPGGEFRAGSDEAKKIPGCCIVLGDRSLKVTVARAVASVSLWQKMKLIYQVAFNDASITQEDVEKCKDKDILEQLLQELGGEFPGIKRVILDERNVYLAHSIYQWAQNSITSQGPPKIVAVVGCGHVKGIVENWGKTSDDDVIELNEIPKSSKTKRVISKTIKYCSLALIVYLGYRVIVPSSIQTSVHNKIFSD